MDRDAIDTKWIFLQTRFNDQNYHTIRIALGHQLLLSIIEIYLPHLTLRKRSLKVCYWDWTNLKYIYRTLNAIMIIFLNDYLCIVTCAMLVNGR